MPRSPHPAPDATGPGVGWHGGPVSETEQKTRDPRADLSTIRGAWLADRLIGPDRTPFCAAFCVRTQVLASKPIHRLMAGVD